MIKKILFYVAAFAVSLVFASNAYANDVTDLEYDIKPTMQLVSSSPVTFASNNYTSGVFDNSVYTFKSNYSNQKNILDNSLSTGMSMFTDSYNVIDVIFDESKNLNGYYIYLVGNAGWDVNFSISYYDSSNTKIVSNIVKVAKGVTVNNYNTINVKNVKRVTLSITSTSDITLREIDFFEEILYLPVTDLNANVTHNTATLSWKLPNLSNLSHILYEGKDISKSVSYMVKDLKPDTEYTKQIVAVYSDGTEVIANVTFKTAKEPDVVPPGDVSDFKGNPDKTFVDLSWSLPTDDDYEKLLLYRDGVLLKTLTTETNYKDEKLNEDTTYKYKIITVDKTGNKSEGQTITVLTKFTQTNLPPDEPLGLTAKPLSKGVKLSWKNPTSGSVKGYKIYMFEKDVASNNILDKFVITAKAASTPTQVNTGLLSSTSYQVSGLENGTAYGFYIVAVNSSGLSSVPSNTVYATPTINSVPPVNIGGGGSGSNGSNNAGFALSDVTSGVSTWFGGIWLILAFAIGIMVSFIIANRIKKLFVA